MTKTGTKSKREKLEAKLFWNGRSQAVRLPKEFRFDGDTVNIRRVEGGILLEAVPPVRKALDALRASFQSIDAILGDGLFPEREAQPSAPVREYFD